ncbi:MAG: sulfurtransferase TusA family protein [Proteobacteria bacterium]|nr:sulfurtransferase TusA family protein [Pseudomonadota bacterium]
MIKTIDARGLSCPQPVILANKAIDEGTFPIEVFVDTVTARENVRRMSSNKGLQVVIEEVNEEFKLTLSK